MIFGLASMAVCTALIGVATAFNWVLLGRTAQGLAAAAFPPAALALISEQLPEHQCSLGISLISLAFVTAAPLMQFAVVRLGLSFSTLMLNMAPLYLLLVLGLSLTIKTTNITPSESALQKGPSILFQGSNLWIIWTAAGTVLLSFVFFYSGAALWAKPQHIDVQMLRLAGLPPLFLTLFASRVTHRHGASRTACLGLTLIVVALFTVMLNTAWAWFASSMLISAGVAFAIPGFIGATTVFAHVSTRGMALAIYSFTLFMGASIAAPLAQSLAPLPVIWFWLSPLALTICAAATLSRIKQPMRI